MRVTVVHPSELGNAELAIWQSQQRTCPGWDNPFLSPEFTVAVGRVRPSARVAVMSEGSRTVGFFPFESRSFGHGTAIAAGLTDCQGLVHEPELDWDPRELLRRCGLAVWEFDHLVSGHKPLEPYTTRRAPSPVIDLTDGFDAYFSRRRSESPRVRDLPRRRRRLTREVGEVSFVLDSGDGEALRTLLSWKSAQYRRTGRSDRFARPWIVDLITVLHAERTPDFSGLLSLLYAGDELVAGHFGLRSRSVIPTWFPAYDTRFGRHSPGLLLHLALAEAAAADGVAQIDMGRGAKAYKESLKSHDLQVAEGRVVRRVPATALHWARRAPARQLRNIVTEHPVLFSAADRLLKAGARVRGSVHRTSAGTALEEAR